MIIRNELGQFVKGTDIPWRKREKILKVCLVCGKKFQVIPSLAERIKFCSFKCYWKNMKGRKLSNSTKQKMKESHLGEKSSSWKGGQYKAQGRWYIYKPNHPLTVNDKYVARYRLIAEKYFNRFLELGEIVHHINGITDDDRPENLFLFPNNTKHLHFHKLKNKLLKSNLPLVSIK